MLNDIKSLSANKANFCACFAGGKKLFCVRPKCGFVYRPPHTYTRSRASSLFAALLFTQRKRSSLSLSPDYYWHQERYRFFGELKLSKYPDKFYGFGEAFCPVFF